MNDYLNEILNACGFLSINNKSEDIIELIVQIKKLCNIENFNTDNLIDVFMTYNGLSVDAETAIRKGNFKSLNVFDFKGGFSFSLKYVVKNIAYIIDDLEDQNDIANECIFPIGNGFDSIMYISENGKIYFSGYGFVADNWDDFLHSLISSKYKDL